MVLFPRRSSASASKQTNMRAQSSSGGAEDKNHATCFCGAVQIETTGQPATVSICHCSRCRKLSGAPFVACVLFAPNQVKVTGGPLTELATSPSVFRRRCESCGGPVMADMGSRVTVLPLSLFDHMQTETGELVWAPQHHMYYDDRVMDVEDSLPKYRASTKGALWEPNISSGGA